MTVSVPRRKRITWTILVAMSRKKIRRVVDLQKMLADIGVEISTQQLGRVVSAPPQRLNWELLEGLLTVLDCKLEDLMTVYFDEARLGSEPTESSSAKSAASSDNQPPRSKRAKTALGADKWGETPPPSFTVLDPQSKV